MNEEILANLKRAEEAIQAARQLLEAGHYDAVASRTYYAAFYGASSLLLESGFKSLRVIFPAACCV